jgi:hypothetical protein
LERPVNISNASKERQVNDLRAEKHFSPRWVQAIVEWPVGRSVQT